MQRRIGIFSLVGAPPVAVVSFAFCQRRFGGPANATGQSILIDNVPFTVAGVAPPEFFGVDPRQPRTFISRCTPTSCWTHALHGH